MAEIDPLQAAQAAIRAASYERDSDMLEAIAYGLLAIAERLPAPVEWRCCQCKHTWREPRDGGQVPTCPRCSNRFPAWTEHCAKKCADDSCPHHPDAKNTECQEASNEHSA